MKELLKEHSLDLTSLILRLTLGVYAFSKGTQTLFYGYQVLELDQDHMVSTDYPIIAIIVFSVQALCSIALILGITIRQVSILMIFLLVSSFVIYHPYHPALSGKVTLIENGVNFPFLSIGISIALLITGAGKWSLGNLIHFQLFKKVKNGRPETDTAI